MTHGTAHWNYAAGPASRALSHGTPAHPTARLVGRSGWAFPPSPSCRIAMPTTRCAGARQVHVGPPPAPQCTGQHPSLHAARGDPQEAGSRPPRGDLTRAAPPGLQTDGASLTAAEAEGNPSCSSLPDQHSDTTAISPRITRRVTGGLLLAASAAVMCGGYVGPLGLLGGPAKAQARPTPPLPLPACSDLLDGPLAAALTRAVYSSVVQLQVMDEADFQRENFKLREREYKYYAEANRPQLPRIPDLADNTGGLSNPAYFNFVNYCLWKVVYRHVTDPRDREAFARAVAAEFLSQAGLGPEAEPPAVAAAASSPEAVVRDVVVPFLELLRAGGYICRYQLVLGAHPGTWPQDWMLSQPALMRLPPAAGDGGGGGDLASDEEGEYGAEPAQDPGSPESLGSLGEGTAGEFLFQLKLHRPADILGSVALRSEEGGAWPRTVSRCLMMMLERRAGYRPAAAAAAAEPPLAEAELVSPRLGEGSAGEGVGAGQQQRNLAGLAEVDEFFYQDVWQGPKSLADRLLLLLGDPLEQVGVDFVPTTLVQNWRLRGPG